jgi:hypothetical protein
LPRHQKSGESLTREAGPAVDVLNVAYYKPKPGKGWPENAQTPKPSKRNHAAPTPVAPRRRAITITAEVHPLAELFPLIDGGEYGTLCNGEGGEFGRLCLNIKEHGLIHPIVRHEGTILDGRNRLLACEHIGVAPSYVEFESLNLGCSPEEYIWSQNMERRHMTADQRAAIMQQWHTKLAAAAKERKQSNLQRGRTKPTPISELAKTPDREQDIESSSVTPTRNKLAKMAKVSEHKIKIATEIKRARPELLDKVRLGEMTLLEAKKAISKPSEARDFDAWREVQRIWRMIEGTIDNKPVAEIKSFLNGLYGEIKRLATEVKDQEPSQRWRKPAA